MSFPNAFNGSVGSNFGGNFPNHSADRPFDFREIIEGFRPGSEEQFRRYAMLRDAELRARLEFRARMEPLPPGVDFSAGTFAGRDRPRERDRDLAMRDTRNRDDRDQNRDRDHRRNDYDIDRNRGSDRGQDRDGTQGDRYSDRSRNRDRSPARSSRRSSDVDARSSSYNDYDIGERDRNSGSTDRYYREPEMHTPEPPRMSDDKGGDKWVCNQPSRTIILRGLPFDIDEKMIRTELVLPGLSIRDIRLIRRASGVSRGFAFVEFHSVADAQRWMEHCQGVLLVRHQRVSMDYSSTRDRMGGRDNLRNDWICSKCFSLNFKRRDFCLNCNLSRKESEKGNPSDGLDEMGTNPCNTLIFRGLDALTTEEGLVTGLSQALLPLSLAPIKNIVIIRDDLGTSRGFGFVEFHSVSASTHVLENLRRLDPPLEVDGKQVLIEYAKNTFNTTMAYIQQKAQAQSSASVTQQQQYDYYSQYYNASVFGDGMAENTTNVAAAVAQAAIQQAQAVKNYQKQIQNKDVSPAVASHKTVIVNGVEYPVYPPPDTSSYQYEDTSGYYYDPLTRLYYDANSQYYYNSTTGTYMYWNAEKSTYLPAPDNVEESKEDPQNSENKKENKEEKKEKEKGKSAKKIAKDMERWAKTLNAQKEAEREVFKRSVAQSSSASVTKQESATADAGFAILQKAKEDVSLMPPPPKPERSAATNRPGLVASYGGDSDSGEEEDTSSPPPVDESKLVDWAKLACLLCKRQFQSKEILSKHIQVSDLHKQNLEALLKSKGVSSVEKIEYRDRAKERRQKYGVPEPPEPQMTTDSDFETPALVTYEEPTKFGIAGDNIGNKLLQKMGWSEGQGLGKSNQGRVNPIEAKRRNQMAGLGTKGANTVVDIGDDYRVALKKTLFARYSELD